MPLAVGTRIGPYEIVAPLGAGGMGEVYRARDPRLGRDVAIKALPAEFARDPERVARFEREAKLLASLSHPNVAGIHGLEEAEGHRYLVLEFVQGETLAARLARGPLPVGDAIEVCRQVAAGVEAAHEAGVVHRDLKPGNVMLRPDGAVKVLDFGLAKAGSPDPSDSGANLSASPTMAAVTTAGVILGTAAYMSPEQARGRWVDKRSDAWSFGCVLYECLTARQAFRGETVSDTIAAILRAEVDLGALPPATPARVRELIARCLCKDARDRLRDVGEARVLLGAVAAGEVPSGPVTTTASARRVPLGLAVSAAVALAAVAVTLTLLARPPAAPGPVRRLDLVANDIEMDWFFTPMLSPDGRRIAYIARNRVWVRDLGQLDPQAVAEVDGLTPLGWSSDSRSLLFNDRKKLWKVPVAGGAAVALCDVPGTGSVIGLAWSDDGKVAFSVWRGGMYQVTADGGAPALLFDIDPDEMVDFHAPSWLPNGDLLHVVHWKAQAESAGVRRAEVAVFADGKRIPIEGKFGGGNGMPTVTSTGQLLFGRRDAGAGIWAVPYDTRLRRTKGVARLVAAGAASISVSRDGTLLYMEGNDEQGPNELVWVDRSGRVIGTVGAAHPGLSNAVLSPDGRRIAFTVTQADRNEDIWVRDLARDLDTRITFAETRETFPQWLGLDRLTYLEFDRMQCRILAVNADGSGNGSVVAPPLGIGRQEAEFTRDGKSAIRIIDDEGRPRLRSAAILPDGSLGPPTPFLRARPEPEIDSAGLSSDGRLLAYATDDPGLPEVFVVRYPGGEGPWQVSSGGGRRPRWVMGQGELFYIGGGGPSRRAMFAVPVDPSKNPPIGTPVRLFDIDPRWLRAGEMPYDVTADGERLLMAREAEGLESRPKRMVLVQNWESELAKPDVP